MLKLKFQYFDVKIKLIRKNPDAWKDLSQNEKRASEDEMVREHHWFNGHEFEQTPGNSGGQRILECYISWSCRVLHDSNWKKKKPVCFVHSLHIWIVFSSQITNKAEWLFFFTKFCINVYFHYSWIKLRSRMTEPYRRNMFNFLRYV